MTRLHENTKHAYEMHALSIFYMYMYDAMPVYTTYG